MIGKSLRERHALPVLPEARAVATVREVMATHAKDLVLVRAQDPRMVACVVAAADPAAMRTCETLGLAVKSGLTAVFGVLGGDVARLMPALAKAQLDWLAEPAAARETKVVLLGEGGGLALLSLSVEGGKVQIVVPALLP
ncbi:MAG: hypothetical protein HOO96_05775 [Polyangiaceae bacterium]|nr:hypothetical protein [Polyangiaceae bacterium]